MSKGNKSKGKARTTSKSKPKASRAKASLAKQTKATNACCPLIKWECKEKKVLLPKSKWDVTDEGSIHRTYGMSTKCVVKFGKKTFKNLDPALKDDKVNAIKKELAERRCTAVEAGI